MKVGMKNRLDGAFPRCLAPKSGPRPIALGLALLCALSLNADIRAEGPPRGTPGQRTPAQEGKKGLRIRVREVPFFRAPRKPLDIWALNFCYCSLQGREMLMTRVQCDYLGQRNWVKAIDYNQRMLSSDNGLTWEEHGPVRQNGPYETGRFCTAWMNFLDSDNGFLLSVFTKSDDADRRVVKVYYEISKDKGRTWSPPRQIIHPGAEYDETHWMPGITAGLQGLGADQAPFAKLQDGTVVCGFDFGDKQAESRSGVVFLRARWNDDCSDLDWDIGEIITGPKKAGPVCEPDLIHLGGQRLFTTMRCRGNKSAGIYSSRQCAVSEDGGLTWSKPSALKHDDGTPVFVPASIAAFERDPATGKVYWFANILDQPVYGLGPRTPLAMAELDTEKLCLIKETVTTIIPPATPKPAYSNFGHYVDRKSGEFVIVPAEQYPYRVDFNTDHYYAYRVKILPGKED